MCPMLTNQASRFLGGGRLWQTANGMIPIANVINAVKLPAARTQITATLTTAWTVAVRTNIPNLTGVEQLIFDAQSGRVAMGHAPASGYNGFTIGVVQNIGLFTTGDHTYMLVSNGTQIQAYRDNVAVGSAVASANNIDGVVRWRSRYDQTAGNWFDWLVAHVPGAALYNIALDAAQRAALHTSLMALPAS